MFCKSRHGYAIGAIFVLGLLFCLILLLLLYPNIIKAATNNKKDDFKELKCENKNEILLYNRFEQKLMVYDTKKKEVAKTISEDNLFQYDFSPKSSIYTSGNSLENKFLVLDISKNDISILLDLNENEGIFPFAQNEDSNFYLHTYYDQSGVEREQRKICSIIDGKIKEIEGPKGLISKGALFKNKLFFSVYNEEKNLYNIYTLNLDDDKINCVKYDIADDNMLVTSAGVAFVENGFFDLNGSKIKKLEFNYGYEENDYIFQEGIGNDGKFFLSIIYAKSLKEVQHIENIIDFVLTEDQVVVYGEGFLKKINYCEM